MKLENSFSNLIDSWEEQLVPDLISIPEPLQTFIRPNQLLIAEKIEIFRHAASPPVIEAFFDKSRYWLAKDLELLLAARQSQQPSVLVRVRDGDARLAVINFVRNGGQTLSCRQRYVKPLATMLLSDPEWSQLSNPEIALLCDTSLQRVQAWRKMVQNEGLAQSKTPSSDTNPNPELFAHTGIRSCFS